MAIHTRIGRSKNQTAKKWRQPGKTGVLYSREDYAKQFSVKGANLKQASNLNQAG